MMVVTLVAVLCCAGVGEDASRRPVSPAELPGALGDALASLIEEENELHARGLLRADVPRQVLLDNAAFLESVAARLPKRVQRVMSARTRSVELFVRLHMHGRGLEAIREARLKDPELSGESLRVFLSESFLRDAPHVRSDAWNLLYTFVAESAEARPEQVSPRVGNAAGRYLLWGALHSPMFWQGEVGQERRQRFITVLLTEGLMNATSRFVAESALAPPLVVDDVFVGTVALSPFPGEDELGGKVGFSREHLQLLSDMLREQDERRVRGEPVDEDRVSVLAKLQRRAFRELFPDAPYLGRDGTLAEALAYWRERLARGTWAAFWSEARLTLDAVVRGLAPHPLDARIRELELELERTAGGDVEPELRKLRHQRERDRHGLSQELLAMMARHGPPDLVREELLRLPAMFAAAGREGLAGSLLRKPWMEVAVRDAVGACDALRQSVAEPGPQDAAQAGLVMGLQLAAGHVGQADTGVRDALRVAGLNGSPLARASVLMNTSMLGSTDAEELFQTALDDFAAAREGSRQRVVLRSGLMRGLAGRAGRTGRAGAEPWVTRLIVETLEKHGPTFFESRAQTPGGGALPTVLALLPPAEVERLVACGVLSDG